MPKVEVYVINRKVEEIECDEFERMGKCWWCKKNYSCPKKSGWPYFDTICFLKGYYGKKKKEGEGQAKRADGLLA